MDIDGLRFSTFIFRSSLCKHEQQESRLALLRVTPAGEGQAWCFGRRCNNRIKQEPDVQEHWGDLSAVTSDQVHLPWEPSPALHLGFEHAPLLGVVARPSSTFRLCFPTACTSAARFCRFSLRWTLKSLSPPPLRSL